MRTWIGLDPGTLLVATAVLAWLVAAIAASSMRVMPQHRAALRAWSLAMAASGGGFLFFALRGTVPFLLSLVVANTLMLFSAERALRGLELLNGQENFGAMPRWAVGLGLLGVVASGLLGAPHAMAAVTVSLGGTSLYALMTLALLRLLRQLRSPVVLAAAIAAGFTALCSAARALMALMGETAAVLPTAATPLQVTTLLCAAVLVVLASMAFFTVAHELHAQARIEHMSRDHLTGLFLRTGFLQRVARQGVEALQQGAAIVMVDLDHFKQVNTRYSYEGGDRVLAHAARRMVALTRLSDSVCRWGGEEFCILLPGASHEVAARFAERLVLDARQQGVRMPAGDEAQYTLSVGIAVLPPGTWDFDDLMSLRRQADEALRGAKDGGRDRALMQDQPQQQAAALAPSVC